MQHANVNLSELELGVPMAGLARKPRTMRSAPARARRPLPQQRYMAFLSYSHTDTAFADWLHESIEQFRVPPRLVGRLTELGPVPSRLTPVFRDRHELAAASDLSDEIEAALAGSRFLIVLCSPAAAKSYWIDQEIICFKKLHGEDRFLAAIMDGEPFASDKPGREAEECFPPALRTHYDGRGRATTQQAEPIAADLRETGDGLKMGLFKVIAGMLGVGLDDLAQREAQRRHRRQTLITGGSILGMLVASGLAFTAIHARDDARDQRREAEKLVAFMLGDLREKLEPLGRLDVLDSVGKRALAYYESQDKADLSDEALAQRSKALTLMGEMAQQRGDLDGALARYREAMNGTAEAVRRAPNVPQNLFDHAQNVFWVGYIDYERGNLDMAAEAFREYRRLADRMIALGPDNPNYRLERIYADTNLGTVLMQQRRYRQAAEIFQQLLEPAEMLAAGAPHNSDFQKILSEALAWLSEAREFSGQLDEALAHRQRQIPRLARLWQASKGDADVRGRTLNVRRALSRIHATRGEMDQAFEQARRASVLAAVLTKTDPANAEWQQWEANVNFDRALLEIAAGRVSEASRLADSACQSAARLQARDRSVEAWRTSMTHTCLMTRAKIALAAGSGESAVAFARRALVLARTEKKAIDRGLAVASAELILGDALRQTRQPDAARGAYERAHAAWPKNVEEKPRELAEHAILLRRLGRDGEAEPMIRQLSAMGFRHPGYRLT